MEDQTAHAAVGLVLICPGSLGLACDAVFRLLPYRWPRPAHKDPLSLIERGFAPRADETCTFSRQVYLADTAPGFESTQTFRPLLIQDDRLF